MTARGIQVQELEAEKRSELVKAQAHMAKVAIIGMEELRPQATVKAEENKKNKLSTLETNSDRILRDELDVISSYIFLINKDFLLTNGFSILFVLFFNSCPFILLLPVGNLNFL